MLARKAPAPVRWVALVFSCVILTGCPSPPSDCPADNATCPSPAPGYDRDVGPLVARYCARCHGPDGSEPGTPLQSFDDVSIQGGHVRTQLRFCMMPPAGEAQPTAEERNLIQSWLACCAASDAGTCPR